MVFPPPEQLVPSYSFEVTCEPDPNALELLKNDALALRADIAMLHERITELNKKNGSLIHERDQHRDRADRLAGHVTLRSRAEKTDPIVGLACDAKNCSSIISIGGMDRLHADDPTVVLALGDLADALGWAHRDGKDLCPTCKEVKS